MTASPARTAIGWREWVDLPDLGITRVKAKADTGARSSSLHAIDLRHFQRDGQAWIRFKVHPDQRSSKRTVECEARVLEMRPIKSSTGHVTLRPVIETTLAFLGQRHTIELTLASRDAMGFRMLLGRQALRGRFLVDPGRSWYGGRPARKKKKKRKPRPAEGEPS